MPMHSSIYGLPSAWRLGFVAKILDNLPNSWLSCQDLGFFFHFLPRFWIFKFLAKIFAINLAKKSKKDEDVAKKSKIMPVEIRKENHSCFLNIYYTVKLARAKLPAMAAGILFRRRNYPRIQAKISAGNDCLWFPPVACGNSPALAGNLHEAFIVRVRADFLKPSDGSFYPVPNTSTEVTLATFEVNGKLFKFDSVPKIWTVYCWLLNPLSKKYI